jgi:hypothetical protein
MTHLRLRKTQAECKTFFNNSSLAQNNVDTLLYSHRYLKATPYASYGATLMTMPLLVTATCKPAQLLALRNHLLLNDPTEHLYKQSLWHVQKMLQQEFGSRFACYFEEHYPRAFNKLVKTTQIRMTWRPTSVELHLV